MTCRVAFHGGVIECIPRVLRHGQQLGHFESGITESYNQEHTCRLADAGREAIVRVSRQANTRTPASIAQAVASTLLHIPEQRLKWSSPAIYTAETYTEQPGHIPNMPLIPSYIETIASTISMQTSTAMA